MSETSGAEQTDKPVWRRLVRPAGALLALVAVGYGLPQGVDSYQARQEGARIEAALNSTGSTEVQADFSVLSPETGAPEGHFLINPFQLSRWRAGYLSPDSRPGNVHIETFAHTAEDGIGGARVRLDCVPEPITPEPNKQLCRVIMPDTHWVSDNEPVARPEEIGELMTGKFVK